MGIDVCPAYRAWRKGAVEKAAGLTTQRSWRARGDGVTQDPGPGGNEPAVCAAGRTQTGARRVTATVGALAADRRCAWWY
jgi:hypothetical protein